MSTIEIDASATSARPKTLSTSWLVQRVALLFLILVTCTAGSVWLYDASLKANAYDTDSKKVVTSAR